VCAEHTRLLGYDASSSGNFLTDVSGQPIGLIFRVKNLRRFGFLHPEDGTYMLSRNVGKKLPLLLIVGIWRLQFPSSSAKRRTIYEKNIFHSDCIALIANVQVRSQASPMSDFWSTKRYWDRFSTDYLTFTLPVSFH